VDGGGIKLQAGEAEFLRETHWCLGGSAAVAGVAIRPPSAGCLTLLCFADYPLDRERPATEDDLVLAAFVLLERQVAADLVLSWHGTPAIPARDILPRCSPGTATVCRELLRSEQERRVWAAALSRMIADVGAGFTMIPRKPEEEAPRDDRARPWDIEWLAALYTSLCGGGIPLTWEAFLWDVPLCLVGHWCAARARHNGVQVHRPFDAEAVAADLRALRAARVAKESSQ